MGNSEATIRESCVDRDAEFLEFLSNLGIRDVNAVYDVLDEENITSVDDLVYSGQNLNLVLSNVTRIGDQAKIRHKVAELRFEESSKNSHFDPLMYDNYGPTQNGLQCDELATNNQVHYKATKSKKSKSNSDKTIRITSLDQGVNANKDKNNINNNENKQNNDYDAKRNEINKGIDTMDRNNDNGDIGQENKCKYDNFVFKNSKLNREISRMDSRRPMILALFDKGSLDHSKVRLIYFSKILRHKIRPKLLVRVFSIDMYIDIESGKNVLSIEGPLLARFFVDGYKCKKYFSVSNLCMNDLIDIAQVTMSQHGEYNKITNNCRSFSQKLMENANVADLAKFNQNKEIKFITNSTDCWMLETYMAEYFDNNFKDSNKNPKQSDDNKNTIDHFMRSQEISFASVKQDFHIRYKYNNLKIIKQGYLKMQTNYLGRWKSVWCVLTTNRMLHLFDDDKMRQSPLDSVQIKGRIVQPDDCNRKNPKNNKFYLGNSKIFQAPSNESLQSWIKTLRYYGSKSANSMKIAITTK